MTNRRPYGLLGKLPSQASTHAALVSEPRENTEDKRDIRAAVFLPEPISESRTQLESVAEEVRFSKSLKHENVIQSFGLEAFHRGWARIVEYVDGEPLSTLIQAAQDNEVTIPVPFATRIVADLCACTEVGDDSSGKRNGNCDLIILGGLNKRTEGLTIDVLHNSCPTAMKGFETKRLNDIFVLQRLRKSNFFRHGLELSAAFRNRFGQKDGCANISLVLSILTWF